MPTLDLFERVADARSALVLVLLIGIVWLALELKRVLREKDELYRMMEERNAKLLDLVEGIYERYVGDVRRVPKADEKAPDAAESGKPHEG